MTSVKPTVYYFRSLNTSGLDDLRVGPFRLGSFSKHFEQQFKDSPLDFIPVTGMGTGPLSEQAELAKLFIKQDPHFQNTPNKVHFFGHSAGGLIAKILLKDESIHQKVRSLITIGTPHRGSEIAEWAALIPKTNPRMAQFYRAFKYNIEEKVPTFESFKTTAEDQYLIPKEIFTGSIVCAPDPQNWSLPFRLLHRIIHHLNSKAKSNLPSDGLIEKHSQVFGDHQWEFELDHGQQIGYGGQSHEFKRMCQMLEKIWLEL